MSSDEKGEKDNCPEVDQEEDDVVGILSATRVEKDFSRYDRQEGNSSSDEEEEIGVNKQDEGEDEGVETREYQALVEDEEFGDFHGFEEDPNLTVSLESGDKAEDDSRFANFYGSRCQKDLQKSPYPVPKPVATEKKLTDNISLPQHLSIPPLSQDKIDKVKEAMSKLNLKPPSLSSISIAEALERSKVRIGDEFN